MNRFRFFGVAACGIAAVLLASTAGVSAAATPGATTAAKLTPSLATSLSKSSFALGGSTVDTATVTGSSLYGSPTGSVTYAVCGPAASPAPCTSPTIGPVTVGLTAESGSRSVSSVTVTPGAPGWYCFKDTYSGDSHYAAVTDNATSECFDVTSTSPTKITPTLTTALSSPSIALGTTDTDTATVTGTSGAGAPTGSVSFSVCGPTASATPCTSPTIGPYAVGLSAQSGNRSTAGLTLQPGSPGWYCFADTYSGDSHYTAVTDNATSECFDVTTTTPTKITPTLTTALSSPSIALGTTDTDTATVTGTSGAGAPTGSVSFTACGPTAGPAPCTAPNIGPYAVGLSPSTGTQSVAGLTIEPGSPGWYCFADSYSGDSTYMSATDNDATSECFDVTTTTPTKIIPTLTTALSSPSVPYGSSDSDTATVTGTSGAGAPTGSVSFTACGPTAGPAPCTAPNIGPYAVGLSPSTGTQATAGLTLQGGSPGWYCFADTYSGDATYTSATDNDATSECFDVTTTTPTKITPTLTTALSSPTVPLGAADTDTATVTGTGAAGSPTGSVSFAACGPTASPVACTSPNIGPAAAGLSQTSGNRSVTAVALQPSTPGWYCFDDTYSGDANYTSTTDNNATSECFDVTNSSPTKITPTLTTALSSPSVPYGYSATDTATVTGTAAGGTPTGSVTFTACGPTASPAPCTAPNVGPAVVGLSPSTGDRAMARVTINPGAPGWYCFDDSYSGDSHYNTATDNNTATECLDVTSSSVTSASAAATRATALTSTGQTVGSPAPAPVPTSPSPSVVPVPQAPASAGVSTGTVAGRLTDALPSVPGA